MEEASKPVRILVSGQSMGLPKGSNETEIRPPVEAEGEGQVFDGRV